MIIDSPQNPLIKATCRLHQRAERQASGLVLAEGPHALQAALKAGWPCQQLFVLEDKTPFLIDLPLIGLPTVMVSERVMRKLATTDSAPPCIGVFARPQQPSFLQVLKQAALNTTADTHVKSSRKSPLPRILVLDQLQDPGNVGTLIRSAAAFGLDAVVTTTHTVDPFSPKVLRASAGMAFALPVLADAAPSLEVLIQSVQQAESMLKLPWLLTTSHPEKLKAGSACYLYHQADFTQGFVLVLGNEGQGLVLDMASEGRTSENSASGVSVRWLTVPMAQTTASGMVVESLNVAVTGAIILAEAYSTSPPAPLLFKERGL